MLGLTTCAMADISGVELGVAPLRSPNFHTVERQVEFVPYGVQASPFYLFLFRFGVKGFNS